MRCGDPAWKSCFFHAFPRGFRGLFSVCGVGRIHKSENNNDILWVSRYVIHECATVAAMRWPQDLWAIFQPITLPKDKWEMWGAIGRGGGNSLPSP